MTIDEAKNRYLSSAPAIQAQILASYAHWLTMLARETYEVGKEGVTDPVTLRRLNEVMHRVTAHILALLKEKKERYPDDVLLSIIIAPEDRLHPESAFIDAVTRT